MYVIEYRKAGLGAAVPLPHLHGLMRLSREPQKKKSIAAIYLRFKGKTK
jgi:hypothetical protein